MGQVDDLLKDQLTGKGTTPKEPEKEDEGDKELRSFRREMLRNKLQKDMFASDQPSESAAVAMIKSQTDLANTLLGQLGGMQKEDREHLRTELEDIKRKREVTPSDPVTAFLETEEKFSRLGEYLKSKLGLSTDIKTGSGDISLLIELEKLKTEREQADRQWKEERRREDRRWKLEDDKWAAEFGLKKEQLGYDHTKTDKVMDNLGDLVKAGIDSMGTEGEEATPVQRSGQVESTDAMMPRSFKCFQCGKMVKVNRETAQAICDKDKGGCGAEYDMVLRKGDTDGQTPSDQRRKVQEEPGEKPGKEMDRGEDVASLRESGEGEGKEADREE